MVAIAFVELPTHFAACKPFSSTAPDSVDGGNPVGGCRSLGSPDFCDDFDTGALGARWDEVATSLGPISADSVSSISPPNSLFAQIAAAPSTSSPYGFSGLGKAFPTPRQHVRLSADVRVNGKLDTGEMSLLILSFDPVPDGITICEGELIYAAGSPYLGYRTGKPGLPFDGDRTHLDDVFQSWHRIALEGTLEPPRSFMLYVDGLMVAKTMLPTYGIETVTGKGHQIRVGAFGTGNPAFDVRFDNVTVDTW
jgi:hypothetical protein